MSEIYRSMATCRTHSMTLRQLAEAVHDAEESGDDMTLLECMDEIERRDLAMHESWLTMKAFMEFYWEIWHKRMKEKV
jgi:hypothetical protein